MPQQIEPKLAVKYTAAASEDTYSYTDLTLVNALPDSSQIEVRWDVNTVYSQTSEGGTSFNVEDLSDSVQEAIKTLVLNTHYTIDAELNTITLDLDAISNSAVNTSTGTFFYPSTVSITSSQFLEIRRSTDITFPVVTFQPGSKLTSENLNLANTQMFNALQELTEFGTGIASGTLADLDLSNNSINDLSDVNITSDGLVTWDNITGTLVSGADIGGLVPNTNESSTTDGQVLTSVYIQGGLNPTPSYDWEWLTFDEVKSTKDANSSLTDRLGIIDTDIETLEGKTQDLSRPNNTATVINNQLSVPNDDILVQGESVYSLFTTKIEAAATVGDPNNQPTDGSPVHAFDFSEFSSPTLDYDKENLWNENTSGDIFTAPRDMTVRLDVTWFCNNASAGNLRVRASVNDINYGITGVDDRNGDSYESTSTLFWYIPLNSGDTLDLMFERDSGVISVSRIGWALREV